MYYLPKVKTYPVLLPLAWLYGLAVRLRGLAFDRGWLPSESFEGRVKVICVGNVAVGGSGKTPHTEYVASMLQRQGLGPVAILSRGYRRQTHGFLLARPGLTAADLGDEPYQMYRKLRGVIVAVDADRRHGIAQLLALAEPPRVVVLDDAMQHRYVRPGLTICLTSYSRILYRDALLPAGRLREPASAVRRADVVVVTKCPRAVRGEEAAELRAGLPTRAEQTVCCTALRYGAPVSLATGQPCELDHRLQVLVMAGIADPTVLEGYVASHYRFMERLTFADHHAFTAADVDRMRQTLDGINSAGHCTNETGLEPIIITTEKDASRLDGHPALDDALRARIYYLPIEVYFPDEADGARFERAVVGYVAGGAEASDGSMGGDGN